MDWRMDDTSSSYRVSPFRHLRIKDYLHLPAAFRSLSRLSSALSAKASTLRSFLLDYSILVIIALITFVTNFWSVTYYSLKNFTVITMSWLLDILKNRIFIHQIICMKFSRYNVDCNSFITSTMETERFELLTPCLQGRCSPNWATPPFQSSIHLPSHTVTSIVLSAA